MRHTTWAAIAGAVIASGLGAGGGRRATAADADAGTDTGPLVATNFTLTLSRIDAAGTATPLTSDELNTYFSAARCACPTSVRADLTLAQGAATKLTGHTLDAQIAIGSDCDNVTAAVACQSLGASLTLTSNKLTSTQSLMTSSIFSAATGTSTCGTATTTAHSTRLWAIIRVDGARLDSEPSLALTLGGAGPKPPTAVAALTADRGLLVSWTTTADATTVQGHQVLCAPSSATPFKAHYDLCPGTSDGGTGEFASLDPGSLCSDLVPIGKSSVRVGGLENDRSYDIAVVAVGIDGTPSAPSMIAAAVPGRTVGFDELYKQQGGAAPTGCAVGGAPPSADSGMMGTLGLAVVAGAAALTSRRATRRRRQRSARRRRRDGAPGTWPEPTSARILAIVVAITGATWGLLGLLQPAAARAESIGASSSSLATGSAAAPVSAASPRTWNLEVRFGPYGPDIDSEFADRGSTARPFEQVFSSSKRLMTALEVDRQLSHRWGTWAFGLSLGYYHATAAALTADLTTRSGDETGLRLIPVAASLVYRADPLRERLGSPLVPYVKAGLDCAFWRMSDTAKANTDGKTLGWHVAAGLAFDLAALDPDAAVTMDHESGVNQTALFFEVARAALDDFGSHAALRVGDTTWFAGVMLEL